MYKLVIMIPDPETLPEFFDHWPDFLHQVERLPGLRREATSHVMHVLFGSGEYQMIHELFFDNLETLQAALASEEGKRSALILHQMTRGKLTLMVADHKEDEIENIQRFRQPEDPADQQRSQA